MRAKQSFTASGIQSCFGIVTPHPRNHAPAFRLHARGVANPPIVPRGSRAPEPRQPQFLPSSRGGEGLLHDARNLVGTIGLYCDLLSMPGVLKPEHRQYPEERRLLGARSKSLIDHLMQSLFTLEGTASSPNNRLEAADANRPAREWIRKREPDGVPLNAMRPPSLRSVVERCSGLLTRVANGRPIEIAYGPAAAVPIDVPDEAIERILVNLVRNAAEAVDDRGSVNRRLAGEPVQKAAGAICIVVGPMVSRVGEHKAWPFQRVRLVVEDTGSGMTLQQLDQLMTGHGARSRGHGIGFCVVRDLVAASAGEIRVMSEAQVGTRVQIEWPIAAMPPAEFGTKDTRAPQCEPLHSNTPCRPVTLAAPLRRREDFRPNLQMEVAD